MSKPTYPTTMAEFRTAIAQKYRPVDANTPEAVRKLLEELKDLPNTTKEK